VTTDFQHAPVLLNESIEQLNLAPGATIVDGTLGGAGHASSILDRTAPDGLLIGLDIDPEALSAARERLKAYGDRVRFVRASFRALDDVLRSLEISAVDGVLLDLGVSSHQLDSRDRGFRFAGEGSESTPLDMRMDPETDGPTAADLLANATSEELQSWFQRYGELPRSRRLARAITEARREKPLRTTADLLDVIRKARIGGGRRHNPATLVFQALRIAVNDELSALEQGLEAAIALLRPGGRLVVISYHSLEDRIVKQRFRIGAKGCTCPPELPVCICGIAPKLKIITRRPLAPTEREIRINPRARSARLRSAVRIEAAA
jgi:16S rRNA (cytosine1402-N4)-methyltransferase